MAMPLHKDGLAWFDKNPTLVAAQFRVGQRPPILFPTLGVIFAAFCVWLGVRIFNRRERWAKWMLLGAVGLPLLYVASFGPACWISSYDGQPLVPLNSVYRPIVHLRFCGPRWISGAIVFYARIGMKRKSVILLEYDLYLYHSNLLFSEPD